MLKVCAVRDRQTASFGLPVVTVTTGVAIRSFIDQVNQDGTQFNQHPEDYDLYQVGEFDDVNGTLIPAELKKLCTGMDVLKAQADGTAVK